MLEIVWPEIPRNYLLTPLGDMAQNLLIQRFQQVYTLTYNNPINPK